MKIKLLILLFVTNNIFSQISKETAKTLSYKQETADFISKLRKEALINKRPEIGSFDVSISFFCDFSANLPPTSVCEKTSVFTETNIAK